MIMSNQYSDNKNENVETLCIGVNDVARLCGVCVNTARRIMRMPGFPAIVTGRRIIIPARAFEEWLNRCGKERW